MKTFALILLFPSLIMAQKPSEAERFKGQDPIKPVNTQSKPVINQWKGCYELGNIFISNEFDGARLSHAELENDTLIRVTVSPENQPVNSSPWYAFKIWSTGENQVSIKLVYPEKVKHRYNPKLSKDDYTWEEKTGSSINNDFIFHLGVSPAPLTVAAQPVVASGDVNRWINSLQGGRTGSAGRSTLGKPIPVVEIGNPGSPHKIVVLGRQHPPEVTGHLALTYFVEALQANPEAKKRFHILVFPLVNPDGADNGHWRHNQGGVDLNRDWADFNQPETRAIRDYLKSRIQSTDTLLFAIDFHSTHDDIYYTLDPRLKTNSPGLISKWLTKLKSEVPGYDPNIKPLYFEPPTSTAFSYLFETYGAESLVFEIGDKTPESFIKKKSQKSAEILLNLLKQDH